MLLRVCRRDANPRRGLSDTLSRSVLCSLIHLVEFDEATHTQAPNALMQEEVNRVLEARLDVQQLLPLINAIGERDRGEAGPRSKLHWLWAWAERQTTGAEPGDVRAVAGELYSLSLRETTRESDAG
jgi:hypothetical protein